MVISPAVSRALESSPARAALMRVLEQAVKEPGKWGAIRGDLAKVDKGRHYLATAKARMEDIDLPTRLDTHDSTITNPFSELIERVLRFAHDKHTPIRVDMTPGGLHTWELGGGHRIGGEGPFGDIADSAYNTFVDRLGKSPVRVSAKQERAAEDFISQPILSITPEGSKIDPAAAHWLTTLDSVVQQFNAASPDHMSRANYARELGGTFERNSSRVVKEALRAALMLGLGGTAVATAEQN